MPTHDIIDNRNEKLVDHIKRILASAEAEREHMVSLTHGQKCVLRELRVLIGVTLDDECSRP